MKFPSVISSLVILHFWFFGVELCDELELVHLEQDLEPELVHLEQRLDHEAENKIYSNKVEI